MNKENILLSNPVIELTVSKNGYGSRNHNHMKAFVSSNLIDVTDNWFSFHRIYGLEYRCKTWNKVKRLLNSIMCPIIVNHFSNLGATSCDYDHKCGCSCGCSPGYKVRGRETDNCVAHGKITFSDEVVNGFKEILENEFTPQLHAEMDKHAQSNQQSAA